MAARSQGRTLTWILWVSASGAIHLLLLLAWSSSPEPLPPSIVLPESRQRLQASILAPAPIRTPPPPDDGEPPPPVLTSETGAPPAPPDRKEPIPAKAPTPMPASSGPPDPEPEVIPELPEATQVPAEMPPEKKQPPPSDTPAPDEAPPAAATVPVPAAEAGQLRPSGPEARVNPAPPYPRPAILRGLHGSVWIEVHLDARGHPVASRLLQSSGHALLDRSALRTVQSQWRFAAPGKEGPTSNAVVQITFALP